VDGVVIRPATQDDAEAIARIYNHYVRTSVATFETVERDAEHRRQWLAEHGDTHPVLVAVHGAEVIGWASVSKWSGRPGWRYTVEASVYLAEGATGAGLGPRLLDAIIEAGVAKGFHAFIAQIVGDNQASLKMVERAGFHVAGTLTRVGNKFDRWLDVVLVELVVE